ncbi:MAG: hypothetical protein AAF502_10560 [Bacteroidota bacterium]
MDQELQNIEIIQRFLNGDMEKAEEQQFIDQMSKDESLKAEVEHYRQLKLGFDTLNAEDFQTNLDSWEKAISQQEKGAQSDNDNIRDINPSKSRRERGILPLIAMAASLVVTVLIFWFLLRPTGVLSTEEILATYTPEHKMPLVRDASGTEHRLKEGIIAFTDKAFGDAADYFASIPADDPQYTDAQIYLGYAQFENENYGSAIKAFETVVATNSPRFKEKADWFAALCYLALERENEWQEHLQRIANDQGHEYNSEALEILEKSK